MGRYDCIYVSDPVSGNSASGGGTVGMQSPWQNWMDEPGVPRVVDGIPDRVDRVKALGNAVVPQQFYIFFKLIADIESGRTN